jgi:Putative Actinobacterial Holin-X, holin superfamily III
MNPTEEQMRNQDADETAELARRATRDMRELVRRETETLKEELVENLRGLKWPAAELGVAGVLGLTAFGMFVTSFGSQRRRALRLLTSTAFGLASYALASHAVRTAAQSVSFTRTAENVERAIDAVSSS